MINYDYKVVVNISLNVIYIWVLICWFWFIKNLFIVNFEFLSINILGFYLFVWGIWGKNSVIEVCWKGKYRIFFISVMIK